MQLGTVASAPAPELAAQALVQLAPGPANAATPQLAAFSPASLTIDASEMVAGAAATLLTAVAKAADQGPAAAVSPEVPRVIEVVEERVVEESPIVRRVDLLTSTA